MGQRASRAVGVVVSRGLALLFCVAMISGCATQAQPPILTPVEVQVPIATPVYCQVPPIAKPALPIASLEADSSPDDTIRAYAATVAILKGAVVERDLAIAGCAPPAAGAAATTVGEVAGGQNK